MLPQTTQSRIFLWAAQGAPVDQGLQPHHLHLSTLLTSIEKVAHQTLLNPKTTLFRKALLIFLPILTPPPNKLPLHASPTIAAKHLHQKTTSPETEDIEMIICSTGIDPLSICFVLGHLLGSFYIFVWFLDFLSCQAAWSVPGTLPNLVWLISQLLLCCAAIISPTWTSIHLK